MAAKETARDQFEDWAPTYDHDTTGLGWIAPAELQATVATHVAPAGWLSVVDLGVGTGQASRAYRDAGARVVGIDVSRAMLDHAARGDASFHALVEHDLEQGLPTTVVRHDDADLILACGALHFVRDLDALVAACRAVLVKGGVLAFTYIPPQARSFGPHTRTHASADVLAVLARAGFTVLEHREFAAYHDGGDPSAPIRYGLVVARDERAADAWPSSLRWIDRTACVDRARLRLAEARVPWTPTTSTSSPPLVAAVRDALAHGEPELRAIAWPEPGVASQHAGCDVLAILPHPDDESIYAGGTLAAWAYGGARVELVVATAGAGGRGGGDALPARRAAELVSACAILGVQALACLAWRDGGKYLDAARTRPIGIADAITAWGLDATLADLVREIRARRPRVLLSLDPEVDPNLSLHGHHLALGWLVAIAFHLAADPDFEPTLGAPWGAHEHRVMAPRTDAAHAQRHAIDAATKRAAVAAHGSQAYSTAALLEALAMPGTTAYEWCRTIVRRAAVTLPLVHVRRRGAVALTRDAWERQRDHTLSRARPRGALVEILRRQAHARAHDPSVDDALAQLERRDAVTVVTGQQVGLLGGPALTLAKAASAIAWARRLTALGIPAVPVFWMASQDHDLDEVRTVARLEAPSLVLAGDDEAPVAVGRRMLGAGVEPLLHTWLASLPPASAALAASIARSHTEDATFAQAFARLLGDAMRGLGLLILDPDDRALAALARDVVARELFGPERAAVPLARARARLAAAGLREVVPTERDVLQLFWTDEHRARRRLRHAGAGIQANGGRTLSSAELVACLELTPERVTPAALLRPVVQDAVLPTIAYVAGPTEARYLAQTHELYAWANVPRPQVLPRGTMRAVTSADVERLAPAGGIDGLDASAAPDTALGLAGLEAATRAVHDRIVALDELLPDVARDDPSARASAATAWLEVRALMHRTPVASIAGQWSHACDRVDAALAHAGAGTRVFTQAHHAVAKLSSALVRDGRRRDAEAVLTWRRVADVPTPMERRMSSAEALLRFSDALPAAVVHAFEHEPDAQLLVQMPAIAEPMRVEPALVPARGRYGVLALAGLGGSGRVAWDVARGLGARGHHVVMLAAAELHWASDSDASLHHVPVPAPVAPTAADDAWIAPLADALVAAVLEHRLDALSVHYAVGLAEAAVVARDRLARAGHPLRICVTLHGSDVTVYGLLPDQRERLRRALAVVDEVTAVSQWLAGQARTLLDLEHAPKVVANAVDTALFFPAPHRERAAGETAVLCHASNFRPIKRPLDGIDVLGRVLGRDRDARLVMIGDGPLRPDAEAHARSSGLATRTTFVGPVAPAVLAGHLRTSDIVLVTSESESFSLVALEAMASGAVLVGTRCGGLEELLARGSAGPDWAERLLAAPGDVDGIADRVTRLLADPALLADARATGLSICQSGFAQHEQLAAYASTLRGER